MNLAETHARRHPRALHQTLEHKKRVQEKLDQMAAENKTRKRRAFWARIKNVFKGAL